MKKTAPTVATKQDVTVSSQSFELSRNRNVKSTLFANMCFEIAYLILENYIYLVGRYCDGGDIQRYATLLDAKKACENDRECNCIYDARCDGGQWITGKGYDIASSSIGSCAWIASSKSKSC